MSQRNTICLWFNHEALEAAEFYAATIPESSVGRVMHAPGDYPDGHAGDVLTVEFTVAGIPCIGLNGGRALTEALADPDGAAAKRAFDAMMTMHKIDIAATERARFSGTNDN